MSERIGGQEIQRGSSARPSAARVSPHAAAGDVRVPIKVWLPGPVYRPLEQAARRAGLDVGQVLAELARRALEPKPKPTSARGYVKMTPELLEEARQLRGAGLTRAEVAARLGMSASTIYNWERGR